VALSALLALVLIAALRGPPGVRGYAEFTAFVDGCFVGERREGVVGCRAAKEEDRYIVTFDRAIDRSAPVVTRSTCCAGFATASIAGEREVLVVFPEQATYPVVANLLVP
jgi:hypothetical protein